MFKIGDFSRLCRVPVSALRYYADIGLLEPAHIDTFTGYRYYTLDQLPRLNRILALKDLGLTLEQIKDLLAEALSPEEIRGMLRLKQAEIQQSIADEQARLARVAARLRQIEQEGKMQTQDVILKAVEAVHVIGIREVIPAPEHVAVVMTEAFIALSGQGVQVIPPPICVYHDQEFKPTDLDVEFAFPVAASVNLSVPLEGGRSLRTVDLPAIEQAACIIHMGDYSQFELSYEALARWIMENGYRIIGPSREIYLSAPTDPNGPVTEIQFPVAKA
ncbi:MAG: MerR family transcriptional regulator [Anaerolineae bacterium]|nr:MerR family transcriptional regulator [Anaerolineae bacterium]